MVYEDKEYLKHHTHIEGTFKDIGFEYFDCGQGYYQDEAEVVVKIGSKFYNVILNAEIGSAKQDRGERLYWVESIASVTYTEIPKPLPKPRIKSKDFAEGVAIIAASIPKDSENTLDTEDTIIMYGNPSYIKNEKTINLLNKLGWSACEDYWVFSTVK